MFIYWKHSLELGCGNIWKDILKDEESYSHQLELIEKIEKLLDKLYDDIEKEAVKLNRQTGFPLEKAREIIKTLQRDVITMAEKKLDRMREELSRHIKE